MGKAELISVTFKRLNIENWRRIEGFHFFRFMIHVWQQAGHVTKLGGKEKWQRRISKGKGGQEGGGGEGGEGKQIPLLPCSYLPPLIHTWDYGPLIPIYKFYQFFILFIKGI